jgi:GST-like protein
MTFVVDHTISKRWPATNPELLQLYSFPTPNGVKVSIALEEIGLPYEAHTVKLNETTTAEFLALNPNNKIPAIIDPDGPDGKPLALWESGAILLYLAEKTGKLMPSGAADKALVQQWLMFQMGGIGPMFGQYGYFHVFAGSEIEDPRPRERYQQEGRRLLAVLEKHLADKSYLVAEEYSIADIAIWPWIRAAKLFYKADKDFGYDDLPNVMRWWELCMARPASERGLLIPDRDA